MSTQCRILIQKREVELWNAHADYFNAEIDEVLRCQAEVDPEEFGNEPLDESTIVHFSESDVER